MKMSKDLLILEHAKFSFDGSEVIEVTFKDGSKAKFSGIGLALSADKLIVEGDVFLTGSAGYACVGSWTITAPKDITEDEHAEFIRARLIEYGIDLKKYTTQSSK